VWSNIYVMDEKKENKIKKERNQVDNREKPVAGKRSRESDDEGKEGNKVIMIDKKADKPAHLQSAVEKGTQD
jgi:hypothetical protein